jgi:Asp-tRNA(Asn)/Glu-tRNA(Gln) amidotransferase A subunit family amidase
VEAVAKALDAERRVTIPENDRARAAATIITVSEGASLHMENLKTRPLDFDPMTRDRFLAGALVPAALYLRAQRFRAWYRDRVREIFRGVDVLLAPTTPFPAPRIGQDTIKVAGVEVPTRPMLGLYTQPLSFIGLPVISVPVTAADPLPLGVQLVAAPWNEAALFRVAAVLERRGTTAPHRVS